MSNKKPPVPRCTPRTAVAYARYSSAGQRDVSIEQQLNDIRAYALREGYTIIHEYADHACSGFKNPSARAGFQAMLAASESGTFDTVLAWKVDRFGRNREDSAIYKGKLRRFGVKVHFIEMTNEEELRAALNDKTRIVYLETPANPNLKITDIEKTARIAHEFNPAIKVICDNTFCSPYIQRPLELGADIVVHSATKYINGHGDLLAGFVVSDTETINQIRLVGIKDMTGAFMPANEAFLVARGLKTLELRMLRHCENAMKVAQYLKTNDKVEKVFYPGLEDHEGHEIAKKQMHGLYGGMVSFIVKGGREKAAVVADNVKVATLAVSLGATETLIEHPASMTHSPYSEEELEAAGIPAGLIRFSVGLENPEDIIADLQQAFDKI